jgi:2-polyprenyl-3-methyl-5-hydroxy-6-metoxy-1,4-benzoquinol methylase
MLWKTMEITRRSTAINCPVCESREFVGCIRISGAPVYCNVLHATRQAALEAARGDIDLRFCPACGHLFNAAFDPVRVQYTGEYENSLHYSGRFQEYADVLARRLIEDQDLRGKRVIEIACGQGDFLRLLCSLGGNRGIGFDPSHAPGRSAAAGEADLTFVQDYYSEAYADYSADLICCRHALEHMSLPGEFLFMLRRAIGDDRTRVFFEVPNALFTLDDLGIWDIIYEHCGYFTEASLQTIFRRNGFRVDATMTEFGGQFLTLQGSPGLGDKREPDGPVPDDLAVKVSRFARVYAEKVERWRSHLQALKHQGRRAVLWGAGSKGVTFLNTLDVGEEIECLIDLNPHKQGRYIPCTSHQVRSPQALTQIQPDAVLIMNPLYAQEIRRDLRDLGLTPQILVDEAP